jgi:hypothetical protein
MFPPSSEWLTYPPVYAEVVRDTNETTRTPNRKEAKSSKWESQGKKRHFSHSQTTISVKECLTLHNYIRKVSQWAVAGGMSNVESDEHYRVKPAYNGTAGDQIFSVPRRCRLPGIVNFFFSKAQVYVMARFHLRQISLYVLARGRQNHHLNNSRHGSKKTYIRYFIEYTPLWIT